MTITTAIWASIHQPKLCVDSVLTQDWQTFEFVKMDRTSCNHFPVSFRKILENPDLIGKIQRRFKGTKISLAIRIFFLIKLSFYKLCQCSISDLTFLMQYDKTWHVWGHFILVCDISVCSTQSLWMCETYTVHIYVKTVVFPFELTSVKSTNLCLMLGIDSIARICWISSYLFLFFSSSSSKACRRSSSLSSQTCWTER